MTDQPSTAVEQLADTLRELILDAGLEAAEPLREAALAAEYGVNRHTVRAALQRLAAQRLVDFEPYRGARVRAFSDDDIVALMQYRTALEAEAVRLLGSASEGAIEIPDAVSAANARLRDVCETAPHDHRAIEEAHAALHHALVAAAGSPRITEAHAGLESELLLFLAQLRPLLPADEMADQHDRLLAEIADSGDAAVRAHLAHSAQQLLALRHDPPASSP
ncbi:GntR family transcriptional regulator [Herbiconiux moechotypicola]|uniref:HTH gntR-type domain-containing protein n=1 Tax=Herbiconiux moechotypicola TaxID=637393 RepID=A0ABN3DDS6_9MICO|nr:GntR family transcriptional regulator [Herbiconiux moechotypicola]MCS5729209.1 GntR family transcriptional regulator [Herbiconiux moechotypicola]